MLSPDDHLHNCLTRFRFAQSSIRQMRQKMAEMYEELDMMENNIETAKTEMGELLDEMMAELNQKTEESK